MNTGSVLAQFTITLSQAVSEQVAVEWRTADGTALAGVDYAAAKGTVLFAPGQTAKIVEILVHGRAVGSEDRSFFVEMLPPTNAILGASIGECIIHVDTTGITPVTQIIVPTGPRGLQGDSAYQAWLDLGNTGTEQDFINSLKPSATEIAQEVAPLINLSNSPLTAEGTETLSKPDTITGKRLARRVAYVGAAKVATVVLSDGDNLIANGDLSGDAVDFNSISLYPRILRGAVVVSPEWSVEPGDKLLIKSAVAGDVLHVCQYDVISGRAVSNVMVTALAPVGSQAFEALRRSFAQAGYSVAGTFQQGFKIVNANDVGIDETTGKGFTGPAGDVAAGTNPTGGGFVDKSREIFGTATVAGVGMGLYGVGSTLTVSDRAGGRFVVVAGGTPDGYGVLDAGNGNTAVLVAGQQLYLEYFGVLSGVESSSAINAAFEYATNKSIRGVDGSVYVHDKQLTLKGDLIAANSVFKPTGPSMQSALNAAIYCDRPAKIRAKVNGADCASLQYGVFLDAGLVASKAAVDIDCSVDEVKNSNASEQCIAVAVFKSSSSTINQNIEVKVNARVDGVTATSNGTVGDNGGSARGILVAFNDSISTPNVTVSGTVKDVSSGGTNPAEDSDGIQVFHGGYSSLTNRSKFHIKAKVSGAKKRGIKVQAPNCTLSDSLVDGTGCLAAVETYGVRTTIDGVDIKNATGVGITSSAASTKITNSSIDTVGTSAPIKFYAGADLFKVADTELRTAAIMPDNINFGAIEVDDAKWGSVDDVTVFSETGTGAALVAVSGNIETLTLSNFKAPNVGNGIVSIAAKGEILVDGASKLVCTASGLLKTTHDDMKLKMRGGALVCAGIPVFTASSSSSGVVELDGTNLETSGGGFGALVSDQSRFINVVVRKTGPKASGSGLSSNNYRAAGCTVENFDTGISYEYSTTAEIYDNVTVDCNTPYKKTGYTPFVEHNNNSR